jgi:DNA-binding NarL/FixJ family response regulator
MTVRVLIVDDQEPFRSAARLVVGLLDGYTVVGEAATGEEGVKMAAELVADMVLMDVNLPDIDGLEATRRIVAANPAVKVLAMSTYEAGEFEEAALASGAVGFISKSDLEPETLTAYWLEDA